MGSATDAAELEKKMRAIAINKSTGVEYDITDIVVDVICEPITEENQTEAEQVAFDWAIEEFGIDNANAGIEE